MEGDENDMSVDYKVRQIYNETIHTVDELEKYINSIGFLPLFGKGKSLL